MRYDAIIVGAGHNGLVAAAYLARAGRSVLVLERRDVIGGAAVTEQIAPGFRMSSASYSLSLLRPDIYNDLELARHGLVIAPKDPQMFVPLSDGRHFFIWRDAARTRAELEKINPKDAESHARWNAFWDTAISAVRPLIESMTPPSLRDVERMLGPDLFSMAVAGSAADTVRGFFDSPEIQGPLVGQGIIGASMGPEEPGTAWIMTFHALGGELNGMDGTWAYVRGGMGSVSASIAAAAREAGAEIRSSAPVARIVIDANRVRGVELEDGSLIESRCVLSNATPHATFTKLVYSQALPPTFIERVRSWRYDGAVVKVNLALSELPSFKTLPGTDPGPQHFGTWEVAPSIEYIQRAREDARGTSMSPHPFIEAFMQSSVDDSLAPAGKHVLSAFSQYAPDDLKEWEAARKLARDSVVATLASFAPNLENAIVAEDVLGPLELEDRFGLTGGDIFHGAIIPEQSFGERFSYRTPIDGLYLCGAGSSPGGGVMGAAGRNCARTVLAQD
ncbi:MAG: phytoene desaturase family protein [Actinomycetota bacterium]